jgi:hypothetical protein
VAKGSTETIGSAASEPNDTRANDACLVQHAHVNTYEPRGHTITRASRCLHLRNFSVLLRKHSFPVTEYSGWVGG